MTNLFRPACLLAFAATTAIAQQNCDCSQTGYTSAYATGFASGPAIVSGPVAAVPMAVTQCVTVPIQCSPIAAAPRYEERTVERTVMVPELVEEKRKVREIEYRPVKKQREVTVYEVRPKTRTVEQKYEVMEPVERLRKERYTVMKPVVQEVKREVTVAVPERVRRTAYRTEYRPEYRNVKEQYTAMVPQRVRRTGKRTVLQTVPVQRTQTVMQDAGYWQTEQVAIQRPVTAMVAATTVSATSGIGGCSPCLPVACGCQTEYMARRVYVPRTVQRQQAYTAYEQRRVEVPYEYEEITMVPVQRERTVRVERVRQVKVPYDYTEVVYRDKKELVTERVERLVEEERERTVRVTEMVPRTRIENVKVTEYEEIPVKKNETYVAMEPRTIEREVTVQVYKDKPTKVTERVRVPVGGTVIR